jgi:Protein of unknown function (DUF4244)
VHSRRDRVLTSRIRAQALAGLDVVETRVDRSSARKEIAMRRLLATLRQSDDGMSTAEYAVGTVAACGFGALLFKILTSGFVTSLLENLISHALHLGM